MANMFDENGNYNKTEWKPGDRITAGKLNKIEESLEAINNNDIERHKEADERLDALEEQKEAVEERFDELEDLVADNKSEVEVLIYENNVKMDRLEQEMNDGINTVDDKIAEADASMKAQVNQGKADMEAMVAEVEADLDGLHVKDEELASQLARIENGNIYLNNYKHLVVSGVWTDALQQALNDAKGRVLYLPNEKIAVDKTIIIPSKTKIVGVSNKDVWDKKDETGTIITTTGSGNPQIWTDILDEDGIEISPLFVFGGNEIVLENISFACDNTNRWSCALFLPCVKRCELRNVYTYGNWTEAGLYLDATWSDKNEYLKDIHTNINPSSGMNELNVYNSYFRGKWGVLIQGTQRDEQDYTADTFIWGYGGTSDLNFYGCRFGCDAPYDEKMIDGGCYKSDAAIKNGIGVGIGHNFFGCSFRTESKYLIYLNRSGRDNFISCYGETINHWLNKGNDHAQFFITGNTYQISRIADKIVAPVYRHSTKLSDIGEIPTYSSDCRMSIIGIDGELNTGGIKDCGIYSSNSPLYLYSRYSKDGIEGNLQILNNNGILTDFSSDRFNLRDIPQIKSNSGFNIVINDKDSMKFTTSTIVNYKHNIPNMSGEIDSGTGSYRWRTVYSVSMNVLEGIRFNSIDSSLVATRTLFLDSSDMQLKYKDHNGNVRNITS